MNIYQFNYKTGHEKDWVAAESIREAMKLLSDEMPNEYAEMDDGITISPLAESEWDKHKVTNPDFDDEQPESEDNWREQTFRQFIDGVNTSIYIAGTMND